jgi:hypothetical protein
LLLVLLMTNLLTLLLRLRPLLGGLPTTCTV